MCPTPRPARPRRRATTLFTDTLFALAVVGCAVLAFGPAARAVTFPDVGPAHPFHQEVEAIVGAGITTGFGDGRFRPDDPVTRQSMAAFLQRGLGRVASRTGEVVISSDSGARSVASTTIRAGGAAGRGAGYLVVTATTSIVDLGVGDGGAHVSVMVDGPGGQDSHLGFLQLPASQGGDTATNQTVIPVTGGQEVSLSVVVEVLSNGVADVIAQSALVAVYVPLGSTP